MGPLTCVIACVVWSLSQSTVPVVCSTVSHVVFATGTSWRWDSCCDGTVKYPAACLSDAAAGGAPCDDPAALGALAPQPADIKPAARASPIVSDADLMESPAFLPRS